jgi:hypothetical protein
MLNEINGLKGRLVYQKGLRRCFASLAARKARLSAWRRYIRRPFGAGIVGKITP